MRTQLGEGGQPYLRVLFAASHIRWPENASMCLLHAQYLEQYGLVDDATKVLDTLLPLHPDNTAILFRLVGVLLKQRLFVRAYELLELYARDIRTPAILRAKQLSALALGKKQKSIQFYRQWSQLDPDSVQVQFTLIKRLHENGDNEQAYQMALQATAKWPDHEPMNHQAIQTWQLRCAEPPYGFSTMDVCQRTEQGLPGRLDSAPTSGAMVWPVSRRIR